MMELKEFYIPFVGLKEGKHHYRYKIDHSFFELFNYDEFNNVDIDVNVTMQKNSTMLVLDFRSKGTVNVFCDLSNEPYNQQVQGTLDLVVKYGEHYNDESDEVLIIPYGEHQINVAQYIYEMIVLSIPVKKIHPGITDGTLTSDVLKKLEELHPQEQRKGQETDPRWDTLKKLLTDK